MSEQEILKALEDEGVDYQVSAMDEDEYTVEIIVNKKNLESLLEFIRAFNNV